MTPSVKILVACHKPGTLLGNGVFTPIHVGRGPARSRAEESPEARAEFAWMLKHMIGDDTGDNISAKNARFNELTAVYWAWKNYVELGDPDYVGLAHYRRHFIFEEHRRPRAGWFEDVERFGENYLSEVLKFSEESLARLVSRYDLIHGTPCETDTVFNQYKTGPFHKIEDLELCLEIIEERFPDYAGTARKYVAGNTTYFCNMFIMKKSLFFKYCEWLFAIAFEFEKRADFSGRSPEEMRFFPSERLTGIFIAQEIAAGTPHCDLPETWVHDVGAETCPEPAFPQEKSVPVVFACDDAYAPYFSVALESLLAHSSKDRCYDIFVLHTKLGAENRRRLRAQVSGRENVALRFLNASGLTENYAKNLFYIEIHVSIATYYRFFIPQIFGNFDKVLYLDCDIAVFRDVAELYDAELGENLIGAAKDVRESIPLKIGDKSWASYLSEKLKMRRPENYFQAGVLVMNLAQMRKEETTAALIDKLREVRTPILSDQDILNAVCEDRVRYVPVHWNLEWQIGFEFPDYRKILPADTLAAYENGLRAPGIIHYASSVKPWNAPERPHADHWWSVARRTPYYEMLILSENIRGTAAPTDGVETLLRRLSALGKVRRAYIRFKFLSKITVGERRRHYKAKCRAYKREIAVLRGFLQCKCDWRTVVNTPFDRFGERS